MLSDASAADGFLKTVTKEEIAQNEQFHLLPQCSLLVIGYPFNYRVFLFFDKICSKSSATTYVGLNCSTDVGCFI